MKKRIKRRREKTSEKYLSREEVYLMIIKLKEELQEIKIALIDDEEEFLTLSEAFLKRKNQNYVMKLFQSSAAFLDFLQNKKAEFFDVIISDYEMPEMNGLELLAEIRKNSKTPFIMVTGKGRQEIVIDALNKGVDYYLQKSLDIESLFRELQHFILITKERLLIERELKETRELYETLVNLSPEGIFIQIDGKIAFTNLSLKKILGYPQDTNFLGKPISEIIPDKFRDQIKDRIDKVHQNIEIPFIKMNLTKCDGGLVDVETIGRLIHYKGKKGAIVYVREVNRKNVS